MNKKRLLLLSVVGLLAVLVYCDPNYFGRQLTRNSSNPPEEVAVDQIPTPDGADPSKDYFKVGATYPQTNVVGQVSPEILFILDTSGSMNDEKDALKAALANWLDQLQQKGVENFCVDVMESTFNDNGGRLRSTSGNPKCLCTDTLSIPEIVAKFKQNVETLSFNGGNGEAGVLSLQFALNDPVKFAENQAAGCFRSDHTLAPIMMSDENDMGATVRDPQATDCGMGYMLTRADGSLVASSTVHWNNDIFYPRMEGFVTTPKTDPKYINNSCDEEQVRLRYYAEAAPRVDGLYHNIVTAESVADSLVNYNDALPSFGTAIVYNSTTFPSTGVESKGWGYFDFAEQFNQTPVNLATTNSQSAFNDQLNVIADALATRLSYIYKFTLPDPVCSGQEDSVKVRVNNTLQSASKYTLSSSRTSIRFKSNFNWAAFGGSAAVVKISYTKCKTRK